MKYPALAEVLAKIKPSKIEGQNVKRAISDFISKLNHNLKGAKAILGGSGAKGTWLAPGFDVDIFVCYDYKRFAGKSSELSSMLEPVIKRTFKAYKRIHGSRDYFRTQFRGFTFELVPILAIKKASEAINIMDISPLHAIWVKRKIGKKADEIRLAKAFCKAQGVYGAESHISGFSGYVCEILTIYYGSFLSLLQASKKWKPGTLVDIEHKLKGTRPERSLNIEKLKSPLIVIDPVQKERNAAAALSKERFEQFRLAARNFLSKQSEIYFVKQQVTIESLKHAAKGRLFIFKVGLLEEKDDVACCKALKALEYIRTKLEQNDFSIVRSGSAFQQESLLWLEVAEKQLSPKKEIIGPPLAIASHLMPFKKEHPNFYERDERLYAQVRRKYTKPEALVKAVMKDKQVSERLKTIILVQ